MKFVLLLSILALTGCAGTVTPKDVSHHLPSPDGNVADSGVIRIYPDKSRLVRPHWRDRYNALLLTYGKDFEVPLKKDDGITPAGAYFHVDYEHAIDFDIMNTMAVSGMLP